MSSLQLSAQNLESLREHYDSTVRDVDGSIVQFRYGEDGVDVTQTGYLNKFDFFAKNFVAPH
jgi:DNA-directed RNA polymerase I subunit RPA1